MEESDELFAFNRTDKDAIISKLLQLGGFEQSPARGMPFMLLLARTKTGGLGANNQGNVFYMEPTNTGWQVTTTEYLAFNPSSTAIAADKLCLLMPVNGRWVAVEICV